MSFSAVQNQLYNALTQGPGRSDQAFRLLTRD